MEAKRPAGIGCCTALEQLPLVCEGGYDFFTLSGSWLTSLSEEAFARLLEQKSGWTIPCRGINSAVTPEVKICGPQFDPGRAAAYAELLCRRAAALGVEMIGVGSPNSRGTYGGEDFRREWQDTGAFLRILCPAARPAGIQIGWEPLNALETPFGIHWDESWREIQALREQGADNLLMLLDLYHLVLQPYAWENVVETAPWICHVHVACPDGDKGRRYPAAEDLPVLRRWLEQLSAAGWHSDISTEVFTGDPRAAGALLKRELRLGPGGM